ncbi:MAG: hypothetical protein EP329_14210 [Deltaproteobacteria bacterium]|nr:MAG: hypothetical protein EP329_14210 [Deltaproteobacteria bacterium]
MRTIALLLVCAAAVGGCLDSGGPAATSDTASADTASSSAADTTTPADTATTTADTATTTADTATPDTTTPDTAECVALGGACGTSAQCCGDAFCPAEVSYNEGLCTAPLADGELCYVNDWCASGVCNAEGTCGVLACRDDEAECWYDDACCSGACYYEIASPYVPGTCGAPQAVGAFCARDSWCASGHCYEGVCASASCKAVGAECQGSWDCCTGVCSNEVQGNYGPGTCLARLATGSVCYADTWCASLSCGDDFTCAEF